MPNFEQQIRRAISDPRLDTFGQAGTSDRELIACYMWNHALSEALTTSIAGLEVALRNALHRSISKRWGDDWYEPIRHVVRGEAAGKDIETARQRLTSQGKPVTPDRMVAELNFGFWTQLFARAYEQRGPNPLWPRLLTSVFFHHHPVSNRGFYAERLLEIRVLRNLSSHHHAIYRGRKTNSGRFVTLGDQHKMILETIRWINPAWADAVGAMDRLPAVLGDGVAPFRFLVDQLADAE